MKPGAFSRIYYLVYETKTSQLIPILIHTILRDTATVRADTSYNYIINLGEPLYDFSIEGLYTIPIILSALAIMSCCEVNCHIAWHIS